MKAAIITTLLLLVPISAFAADGGQPTSGDCYQKTITVCPTKKPKKKLHPTPPPVAAAPECPRYPDMPSVPKLEQPVPTTGGMLIIINNCPGCEQEPKVVFGGYASLGLGVRDQYISGNLGLQLEFPKAHLGLRAFSAMQNGVGFQGLIYVYRGDKVKVHVLDPGVHVTGSPFSYTNNRDVDRRVDLLLGAGVQVKLTCHLSLLVDWRVNIADPRSIAERDGKTITSGPRAGTYLDAANVTGNSFSSSQVQVGLLLHL